MGGCPSRDVPSPYHLVWQCKKRNWVGGKFPHFDMLLTADLDTCCTRGGGVRGTRALCSPRHPPTQKLNCMGP